jgi:predicted ATPase
VGIEPSPTAATTTTTTVAKNPRLIPLVEEKSGFWVLKPEHRAGINPAEKVKKKAREHSEGCDSMECNDAENGTRMRISVHY